MLPISAKTGMGLLALALSHKVLFPFVTSQKPTPFNKWCLTRSCPSRCSSLWRWENTFWKLVSLLPLVWLGQQVRWWADERDALYDHRATSGKGRDGISSCGRKQGKVTGSKTATGPKGWSIFRSAAPSVGRSIAACRNSPLSKRWENFEFVPVSSKFTFCSFQGRLRFLLIGN